MQRTKPPFRADHVGSLLRTAPIKQARAQREKGEIDAAQLKAVEDREIEKIIKKQEEIGLKLATDGEFRRSWWHFDFFSMLDGVELYELDHGIQFHGVQTKMQSVRVKGKIGFSNHPMLEHFKFLKAHTKVTPKMTIPAPSVMHFRLEPGAVSKNAYPEPRRHLRRSRHGLSEGDQGVLRRRLPLSAVRRHRLGLSLLEGGAEEGQGPRPRRRSFAGDLHGLHQQGAGGQARRHDHHHPCLPRQFPLDLHLVGRLRAGGAEPARQVQLRRLLPGIRQRPRRRLRAAALLAEGQQDRRARPGHLEVRPAGAARRHQEAHRGGNQICRARSAVPVAAMRLCLHRGRQRAGRGRAMGQAAHDRGIGGRGVGK